MKKLQYTAEIMTPSEHVYETMLGLKNKNTYEQWVAVFNPSSTYEGSWDTGAKILFIGTNENGKKGGMVARIAENTPAQFVSIRYYGILEDDIEITEGPKIEGWSDAQENYRFEPTADGTKLTVEIDMKEEFAEYFDATWPGALTKLKDICENK